MDNCADGLKNIEISSSTDSDSDSDNSNLCLSDSESNLLLSSAVFPVQYRLPPRNQPMDHSPRNRTIMDRMAASNRSIRMRHGTTALDVLGPLHRDRSTSLSSASTTQRNPTTRGTVRHNTTTQMNRIPMQNASSVSLSNLPGHWMFPSSSSSRTVSTSYRSQVPTPPPRSRPSAPPYSSPPAYTVSSITSQTFRYHNKPQRPKPPYRYPCPCPPYTTTSFSLTYTSQSSATSNMSQTSTSSVKHSAFYTKKYPTPTKSTTSFVPIHTHQNSTTSNTSQTSTYYKSTQSSTPSYRPRYPTPTDSTSFSESIYTSPYSTTPNASQTSMSSTRTQSSAPSYRPQYPTPTDNTQSSMPIYTSLYSAMPSASQTYTSSIASQYTTPSCDIPYSTPPCISKSSMPIYIKPQSSSPNMSQPSGSSYHLMSPSIRMNPCSAHYNVSPTYSHYTFPRSAHYTMAVLGTYCTVMPRSSAKNSYSLSVYEPPSDKWPTKVGSVMHASMQNIWSMLNTELNNASTTVGLQNSSRSSYTTHADKNTSLPPNAPLANDQPLQCVNREPSDSSMTTSNACAGNHNEQTEVIFMSLNIHNIEKNHQQYINMLEELKNAWTYFSNMEVIDIKPNGEIKCICPALQFDHLHSSSINEKLILVNLYRQYKANNLMFETTYDYKSSPRKTIVTENLENTILQWLISTKMDKYDWFFNSLGVLEIENINPANIQKFIMRSKCNKTISLEDQMKICCMIKKVKERPVSLLAISINLRKNIIGQQLFTKFVMPYIVDILQFPIPSQIYMFNNIVKDCNDNILRKLLIDMMMLFNADWAVDENITTVGDLKKNLMASIF